MPDEQPRRFGWSSCGLVASLVLASACTDGPDVGRSNLPVIFDEDDRVDVYEHPDPDLRGAAIDASAVLAPANWLVAVGDGTYTPFPETLGEGTNLCAGERFADQPWMGECSATLIDDDLVLTAGHCTLDGACPAELVVFDYYYEGPNDLATIDEDDVYACAEVLAHEFTPEVDFAVLRLDRPVLGREPAPIDVDQRVREGDAILAIGFPSGIPCKIDDGGTVINARGASKDYFVTTNDFFGGSSGSGVYAANGNLVGLGVRGLPDYVDVGECAIAFVLSTDVDDELGNHVGYVAPAIEALCASDPTREGRLCRRGKPRRSGDGCSVAAPDREGDTAAVLLYVGALLLAARVRRRARPGHRIPYSFSLYKSAR